MINFLKKFADENGLKFAYLRGVGIDGRDEVEFRFTNPETKKLCGHKYTLDEINNSEIDILTQIVNYTEKHLLKETNQ